MSGTVGGGQKAAATTKQRYGKNFYRLIGSKGGKISRGGGFAKNPELARTAGAKGGRVSFRGRLLTDEQVAEARRLLDQDVSYEDLAVKYGVAVSTIRRYCRLNEMSAEGQR